MRTRYLIPACCIVVGISLPGCGSQGGSGARPEKPPQTARASLPPFPPIPPGKVPDPLARLEAPDRLTLYSIDGRDDGLIHQQRKLRVAGQTFHNYPVLGKVEISDPARRKEIITALKEMAESGGLPDLCFWPRHAVRAVEKGRTIDFVICFECSQMSIQDGDSTHTIPFRNAPRGLFNRLLEEAGVPLAPTRDEPAARPPPVPPPPPPPE